MSDGSPADPAMHHETRETGVERLALTANFHLVKNCNFSCAYCYATFNDPESAASKGRLPDAKLFALTRVISRRYTKITFAGGEPTLYRRLPELVVAAKREGAITNVVTNGFGIDAEWISSVADCLDFITISIDSASEQTHHAIGRATRAGQALTSDDYLSLATLARLSGVGVKVNTVVTTVNQAEDLSALIRSLSPERWKILQAAPVEGQNDRFIDSLTPESSVFENYVARHRIALRDSGIRVVPEPIETIRGSYVMVDPAGRFFDSTSGRHRYSRPILDVGIDVAFEEVTFQHDKFLSRGGDADYGLIRPTS